MLSFRCVKCIKRKERTKSTSLRKTVGSGCYNSLNYKFPLSYQIAEKKDFFAMAKFYQRKYLSDK